MTKAQELFDVLFPIAAEIVARGDQHQSILCVDQHAVLTVLDVSSADKVRLFGMHRELASTANAVALIQESWIAKGVSTDPVIEKLASGELSVSELPLRGECIVFNIREGEQQWISVCMIERKTGTLTREPLNLVGSGSVDWAGRAVGNGKSQNQKYH